jgi:osmoprotectant transport system permease protein
MLRQLWQESVRHLILVFLPLLLNIVVAIPLGIWAFQMQKSGKIILALVSVAQTIPSLALLVFLIPLLGVGFAPALAALFIYGLLPIMKNTYEGLQSVPQSLRESADALGLSTSRRILSLDLPMASPMILAGIRIAAVLNVGTATLGAIIGAGGYGESILTGVRHDDMRMLMQGAVPAALLALLIQGLFASLEKRIIPRGLRLSQTN